MSDVKVPPTARGAREKSKVTPPVLPAEHLERVMAWGGATAGMSYVYRPSTAAALHETLTLAQRSGRTVGLRGGGNSYGDAAMNSENVVVDLRRMNRILEWDATTGRIRLEPGVTLAQLWQYVLEDGWWPPVATGTSLTTMGGSAAMNVHGKNAFRVGPIGDHILEFDLMLASGEKMCIRDSQSAVAGAERIFGLLDETVEITDRPGAAEMPAIQGHVVYRDVHAEYNPGEPVLRGVDIEAQPGQSIAIVGPTGAGKTTIINLLPRFWDVSSGSLTIDGIDVRDVTQASLRRQIGIVLQDSFLFSDTVMNNIRYGRPERCV